MKKTEQTKSSMAFQKLALERDRAMQSAQSGIEWKEFRARLLKKLALRLSKGL